MGRSQITRVIGATGKIVPRDRVMVGSEVSGRLARRGVLTIIRGVTAGSGARIMTRPFPEPCSTGLKAAFVHPIADIDVQKARIRSLSDLAQAQQKRNSDAGVFFSQQPSQRRRWKPLA